MQAITGLVDGSMGFALFLMHDLGVSLPKTLRLDTISAMESNLVRYKSALCNTVTKTIELLKYHVHLWSDVVAHICSYTPTNSRTCTF